MENRPNSHALVAIQAQFDFYTRTLRDEIYSFTKEDFESDKKYAEAQAKLYSGINTLFNSGKINYNPEYFKAVTYTDNIIPMYPFADALLRSNDTEKNKKMHLVLEDGEWRGRMRNIIDLFVALNLDRYINDKIREYYPIGYATHIHITSRTNNFKIWLGKKDKNTRPALTLKYDPKGSVLVIHLYDKKRKDPELNLHGYTYLSFARYQIGSSYKRLGRLGEHEYSRRKHRFVEIPVQIGFTID